MDFIVDFYKELETLDLIIFWGIIIVIILLIIFSLILLNKNKKLKKIMNKNNISENDIHEELPIKKENELISNIENNNTKENQLHENIENNDINSIVLPQIPFKVIDTPNNETPTIQTEKKFIAEEHVIEYNNDLFSLSNIKKTNEHREEQNIDNIKNKSTITMPSGPYQRNVLREMSLSQTSPIGITIPKKHEDRKEEMLKDLEESLNTENKEIAENKFSSSNEKEKNQPRKEQSINYQEKRDNQEINKMIQKELSSIKQESPRKTEIKIEDISTRRVENKIEKPTTIKTETKTDNINKQPYDYNIKTNDYKPLETNNRINTEINKEYTKNITEPSITTPEKINEIEKTPESLNDKSVYNSEKTSNISTTKEQSEKTTNIPQSSKNDTNQTQEQKIYEEKRIYQEPKEISKREYSNPIKDIQQRNIDPQVKQLLNSVSEPIEKSLKKSSSEKYLEEVSRKLAEAEIPEEIERTDYELEQEEKAIISYKELMEKKDSIQTIDEEEAVISIEELMNRKKQQEETSVKENKQENSKLYNITEEEENDEFIKELKQFRNDL